MFNLITYTLLPWAFMSPNCQIVCGIANITNLCRIYTNPKEFDEFHLKIADLWPTHSVLWLYIPDCSSFQTAWNVSYNYSIGWYYNACWLICDHNTPVLHQQPKWKYMHSHLCFASLSIALASHRMQQLCAVLSQLCLRPAGDGRTLWSPEILKSQAPRRNEPCLLSIPCV